MLPVGTKVKVIDKFRTNDDLGGVSTIAAIQWVAPDGSITEEPQEKFQYLLDAEEPYPDFAMAPENVEEV